MSTNTKNVSRDMTIEEILNMFPHKAQRLAHEITSAGLHCVGCQAATWETLEAGMMGHGMDDAAIERLVDRLNALLHEKSDPQTISITKRAAKELMDILEAEGKQGWSLRIEERMAGCSGFENALGLAEKADESDDVFESEGIQIVVHKSIAKRLMGSEVDFVDGLNNSGFKISNPNVKSSCGCGSSYNY
jgi:iron-sulfur cluster assembly accessory protein